MSDIRFVDPPPPEPGARWCLMCLMTAKQYLLSLHPDLPKIAADGQDDRVHWVAWDNSIRLCEAIADGLSDIPQLGLIPVCWSHLAAVRIKAASPLVGPDQLPPGLIRGRG